MSSNDLIPPGPAPARREFGRIYPPSNAWLAKQAPEAILEPEIPIIDTHFHVFDLPGFFYGPGDFTADLESGHRVEATVFTECKAGFYTEGPEALRPVGETATVVRIGDEGKRGPDGQPLLGTGIVGFADLALGAQVEDVLQAHLQVAGNRFKGIRYVTSFDPSPAIAVHGITRAGGLREPATRAGLATLARLGLSFDAFVFFHQLAEVAEVADAHPELPIILGHCGGLIGFGPYAGRRDEVFATWKAGMADLARRPNVSVKLGGMFMRLATFDYLNIDVPANSEVLAGCLGPYMSTCIELFGADRCMFESNFPVDKMATGYAVLWNAYKRITAGATPSEKLALYAGTARRVYRLA